MASPSPSASAPPPQSYYALLCLPPPPATFSDSQLKRAYHRALLRYHPDKIAAPSDASVSVDAITTAYKTLLSPALREEYNRSLLAATRSGDDSAASIVVVHWDLDEMEEMEQEEGAWGRRCRCGEMVHMHEDTLEEGGELGEAWVVCEGCSIVYCVSFEMMDG